MFSFSKYLLYLNLFLIKYKLFGMSRRFKIHVDDILMIIKSYNKLSYIKYLLKVQIHKILYADLSTKLAITINIWYT